ncbi:galactonate dehydratase [Echinicola vietnamensis]|uniref:Enolase superfamily enzyme related to L-alanine-DL-glutamate epimerase n=1 Tax=Echinicola vietnamensis (strain DSM 17526 / LMG 23754 / KMM 6221) TaxID=926556 RepID=L0G4P1_ECHVK|nr:galactonate dehydratase [Echinicola vietnamensis]AGA79981.1 enolase superfamily enzyme related to L-alanine-DL-glutamate epimerase [Echinicola vietnamensis DSM 17526]
MSNDLKIERIELFKVPPRWLFVKITTKSGLVGWGEPVIEGKADTVAACVREMEQYLIGRGAHEIEDIWQVLYRGGFYRGGPILMSALSGIDQALWDIKGKHLNVPVYELLGGAVRQKMKMYCWIGGDHPEVVLEQAQEKVDAGYTAVKMNATGEMDWVSSVKEVKKVVENIKLIRQHFGDSLDVGLDFHGRVHKPMVKRLIDELSPFDPLFIEEPVLAENNDALGHIYRYSAIPIATGERMFSRWDFKEILHQGVVDIIQPDLSHAGGISEVRRIATMAEAYDITIAPHCPLGPISLASALHVDFVSANAFIQESSLGIHYNQGFDLLDYVKNPEVFDLKEGYIDLFDRPGLGVEMDEERLKEGQKIGHHWANPIWRNADGSFAEW